MNEPGNPRHVLITGASRGIGAAIARRFVAAGDRVTVLGRTQESAETARMAHAAAFAVAADVTDGAALTAAIASAQASAGPVDVLVNNAGGVDTAPLSRLDVAMLRRMFELNVEPVLVATKAVAEPMKSRGFGRIVNVASTAGLKGYAYVAAYAAAKHAVLGLTRSFALELAGSGVTVNAVCPGYTDTDLISAALDRLEAKTGRVRAELLAEFTRHNPMGRLIAPEEVADSVFWLAGSGASAITGQAIAVAGGEL